MAWYSLNNIGEEGSRQGSAVTLVAGARDYMIYNDSEATVRGHVHIADTGYNFIDGDVIEISSNSNAVITLSVDGAFSSNVRIGDTLEVAGVTGSDASHYNATDYVVTNIAESGSNIAVTTSHDSSGAVTALTDISIINAATILRRPHEVLRTPFTLLGKETIVNFNNTQHGVLTLDIETTHSTSAQLNNRIYYSQV